MSYIQDALLIRAGKVFDVILLDLNLPYTQGEESFDLCFSHFPYTPIIITSGIIERDTANSVLNNGALDYIRKI
ncbi:MAG: DNA-binding NtrC family response regulator [Sphingobacteriales bacterium]